ncbi:tubulin-tyrosine ligase family-domain-containing protein [Myxozyma melibiosi]|uniref:Tubulin-tyrosine ligase family-domain-containing protein n=1 Tax=Myxozyma melibiosi TaxID=54550 RepID=A0ABR1F062_9ASCO
MHVLITNDDGPPGKDSPYIAYFIQKLRELTDWDISVALPDCQKSWIGKAHFVGKTMTASYITPAAEPELPYEGPYYKKKNDGSEEWVLLDGTPASCAQVGIHHLFKEKGPVDLVIAGPNYGRNSSAVFILSSGTIGGAMEGALCGVPAIGVSFAYSSRNHVADHINTACSVSVRLIKHLCETWPKDDSVDLFSINVPLGPELREDVKIMYTNILANRWGSAFEYVEDPITVQADGTVVEQTDRLEPTEEDGKLTFKWLPNLAAVTGTTADEPTGTDKWAIGEGYVSVSPLKANFQGAPGLSGELKLTPSDAQSKTASLPQFTAVITYPPESYIYPLLVANLKKVAPGVEIKTDPSDPVLEEGSGVKVLHYADYEDLNFERMMGDDEMYLACSYIYRKALIRKNFLAHSIANYAVKHPDTILKRNFPESYELELDYAEYLDEMLDDIYEFRDQLQEEKNWWILKPSMSDRGQGIRIFKTFQELQEIFESFEESDDEEEEEEEEEGEPKSISEGNGIVTSQIRHFLIQRYIEKPLLLPSCGMRKFHIRTYVVASQALKVYVYKDMLALFAKQRYSSPDEIADLEIHLTNTCLQGDKVDEGSVRRFWDLEGFDKEKVWDQIKATTAETFAAAVGLGRVHFQPIPNAFEIYGLDFLVDEDLTTRLLEVNAYPDFGQTGEDLKVLVDGLFACVADQIVVPFFGGESRQGGLSEEKGNRLALVYEQDVSGGW